MKIESVLHIGASHTNHCEDYLLVDESLKDILVCAVMDGCTMGNESYFASTLTGKLLHKILREKAYKDFYTLNKSALSLEENAKYLLQHLFAEIKQIRNFLLLETHDLLTTLILALVDRNSQEALILVLGDGVVTVNGEVYIFDQENTPDYFAYHLSEDFETWYGSQTQKIYTTQIQNLAIATDGIETFLSNYPSTLDPKINPIEWLMTNPAQEKETLLSRFNLLANIWHLQPLDDVAIVRITY
ncbi:protein phosphatase 2C domain-containing protein [Cytophagaceae bacterium DM2B3-1]|uniref:Protein phosphatase 2C domain-containing protein n=1 Tax=Xanthocytophaga flava TaxID=3048013 RepID=A0ABT7CME7_9BACT|nr:protein phosphatase 2C domain-containing protein [Xanthocytophaga flavus]MDJ1467625.1 protein phosphatase 2C domain-containing protein [Xanthocytophaga flavus]MDJ1494721.1 protein phosphatase 2C domain-containing protein [Xanthocytophaga flavus]